MKHIAEQLTLLPPEPQHSTRAHHQYGMSKLDYLDACPGYASRAGTSEAAEDGTRLHEVMDKVISHFKTAKSASAIKSLESVLRNETVSDEEQFYLEFCCKELDYWLARKPTQVLHEQRATILNPDGTVLNYGHYDTLIFLSEQAAVLFDYKFGYIPVRDAEKNLQGRGYALGCFQKYPGLQSVGVVFIQPKLNKVTRCIYKRSAMADMYQRIQRVIANAKAPAKRLSPSTYCDYCAHAGTCSALMNDAARAVQIHEQLPMPATFSGLQINTPEECAKALYVLDRLEVLIQQSGLKDRAKEFARNNGGFLQCEISPGKVVKVELKERNSPRSANSPALIADALKDVLTPEQVLGACDPKITRLEEIFAEAFVEQRKKEADKIISDAEAAAKEADSVQADELREEAKVLAKAHRVTKKQAREILASTLSAEGLLSASEGRVEYLKVRLEDSKQLTPHTTQNG